VERKYSHFTDLDTQKENIYIYNTDGISMHFDKKVKIYDLKFFDSIIIPQENNTVVIGEVGKSSTSPTKQIIVWMASKDRCNLIQNHHWIRFLKAINMCSQVKPNVMRGVTRNGISSAYFCFGFRKDPLTKEIGKYTYKHVKKRSDIEFVDKTMNDLVFAMEETVKPFFRNNSMVNKYKQLKNEYNIPSMNPSGYATQLSIGHNYCSPVHVDKDYMYTVLTCFSNNNKSENHIIYHFCFPEYNIVIPMKSGTVIVFDPRILHCASNPTYDDSYIMSCYVSKKTVDTVVASKMRLEICSETVR
jgi:hypothetical protein